MATIRAFFLVKERSPVGDNGDSPEVSKAYVWSSRLEIKEFHLGEKEGIKKALDYEDATEGMRVQLLAVTGARNKILYLMGGI